MYCIKNKKYILFNLYIYIHVDLNHGSKSWGPRILLSPQFMVTS
jgi:hypothetical protein